MDKDLLKIMVIQKIKNRNQEIEYEDSGDFIRDCFLNKTPQSYGPNIQKRIIIKNGMIKRKHSADGDIIDTDNRIKEIKASISCEGRFNIVQIRPHQDFYSYLLFFFEIIEDGEVNKHIFEIPKNDIMSFHGIGGAHGTKESNTNNKNVEYRVTINKNDDNWNILNTKYKTHKEF